MKTLLPALIGAELMGVGVFIGMVVSTHNSLWSGGIVGMIVVLAATTIFAAIWEHTKS